MTSPEYNGNGLRNSELKDEDLFSYVSNELKTKAYNRIQQLYDNPQNPENRLAYHNTEHTFLDVTGAFVMMAEAIHQEHPSLITRRDIVLGTVEAGYHDIVQDNTIIRESDSKTGRLILRRSYRTGDNEKNCGLIAVRDMKKRNKINRGLFTTEDIRSVKDNIKATTPRFHKRDDKLIVSQPGFAEVGLRGQLLCLADLRRAGLVEFDRAIRDSKKIILEFNPDIEFYVRKPIDLSGNETDLLRERILDEFNSQSGFLEESKNQTERDLKSMPEQAQEILTKLFCKFDPNIESMKIFNQEIHGLSYEELSKLLREALVPIPVIPPNRLTGLTA